MKKQFIRWGAMAIAGSTLLCGLAGCAPQATSESESNASSETAVEKKDITFPLEDSPTITMMAPNFYDYTFDNCLAWNVLQERRYVDWDVQGIDTVALAEKRNLALSTNQYPDVFWKCGFTQSDVDRQAEIGVFIPLEDLIKEYAPNLQKILDENPTVRETITSKDGHIYSLPQIVSGNATVVPTWINAKWLKNLGLEEPKSLDELHEVLKAFKEKDANGNGDPNDEIPFTTDTDVSFLNFLPYFGTKIDPTSYTRLNDGKIEYVPAGEEFKEMAAYFKQLYAEGLIDQTVFSQSEDQVKAKVYEQDNCGMLLIPMPSRVTSLDEQLNYDYLNLFEPHDGVYRDSGVTPGTLTITDKCENPEIVIAWADYFYTEEGGALCWCGIEGRSYEYDENGVARDCMDPAEVGKVKMTLSGGGSIPSLRPEELRLDIMQAPNRQYNSEVMRFADTYADEIFPHFAFSDEVNKEMANISAILNPYVAEYFAKVVVGEYDLEATWDDYINNLKQMGMERYVEIYQQEYDAMQA